MNTKEKVGAIASAVILIIGTAIGYYLAPTKVKVETKIVEVEKKTEQRKTDTDRDKRKETTVTEITKPDGTKEVVTRTVEDTKTTRKTETEIEEDRKRNTERKEETSKSGRLLGLSLLTGVSGLSNGLTSVQMVYGVHATYTVFGPVSLGVWGMSNVSGGLSVGFNF